MFGQLELIIEEKRETELPLANSTMRFGSREGKIEKDLSTGDSPAVRGGGWAGEHPNRAAASSSGKFQIPSVPRRSLVINDNGGPGDRGIFSEGCDLLAFQTLMCSTCLSASQTRPLHMPCSTAALSSPPCIRASGSTGGCFQLDPSCCLWEFRPQTSFSCL